MSSRPEVLAARKSKTTVVKKKKKKQEVKKDTKLHKKQDNNKLVSDHDKKKRKAKDVRNKNTEVIFRNKKKNFQKVSEGDKSADGYLQNNNAVNPIKSEKSKKQMKIKEKHKISNSENNTGKVYKSLENSKQTKNNSGKKFVLDTKPKTSLSGKKKNLLENTNNSVRIGKKKHKVSSIKNKKVKNSELFSNENNSFDLFRLFNIDSFQNTKISKKDKKKPFIYHSAKNTFAVSVETKRKNSSVPDHKPETRYKFRRKKRKRKRKYKDKDKESIDKNRVNNVSIYSKNLSDSYNPENYSLDYASESKFRKRHERKRKRKTELTHSKSTKDKPVKNITNFKSHKSKSKHVNNSNESQILKRQKSKLVKNSNPKLYVKTSSNSISITNSPELDNFEAVRNILTVIHKFKNKRYEKDFFEKNINMSENKHQTSQKQKEFYVENIPFYSNKSNMLNKQNLTPDLELKYLKRSSRSLRHTQHEKKWTNSISRSNTRNSSTKGFLDDQNIIYRCSPTQKYSIYAKK